MPCPLPMVELEGRKGREGQHKAKTRREKKGYVRYASRRALRGREEV